VLLDIDAMVGVMKGVVMELTDCALPLLKGSSSELYVDMMTHVILLSIDCLDSLLEQMLVK